MTMRAFATMEDNTFSKVDEIDESGEHEGVHHYQRIIYPIAVLLGILIKTSTKAPSDPSVPIPNRCFFIKCPSEVVDGFYSHLTDKRDMLALLMSGNKQHVNSGKQAIWSRCTPKGYDTLVSIQKSTSEYNAMIHHLDLETEPVLPELNNLKTLSLLIRPKGADEGTFRSMMVRVFEKIGNMKNLQRLSITYAENTHLGAKEFAPLKQLTRLTHLKLTGRYHQLYLPDLLTTVLPMKRLEELVIFGSRYAGEGGGLSDNVTLYQLGRGLPHLRKLTLHGCFDIGELHDYLYDDFYDSPPLFPVMDYMYLIGDSTPLPCESPREVRITGFTDSVFPRHSRVRVIAAQLIAMAPGLKHFDGLFVVGDVSISFSKLDGKTRC
ncbi:hypothetical protein D6D28_06553 [Aureobasidium pullulans]|uniref:Uncharacterized protein n=1 Tax=Aureobasidium pullulans TaxID=5580 RepID=A0A4S8SDJ8_AURPU|nr:hypothetical protein D6D28_06553 [Aureobasidium pullulans]